MATKIESLQYLIVPPPILFISPWSSMLKIYTETFLNTINYNYFAKTLIAHQSTESILPAAMERQSSARAVAQHVQLPELTGAGVQQRRPQPLAEAFPSIFMDRCFSGKSPLPRLQLKQIVSTITGKGTGNGMERNGKQL
jgi:hypothetical protein